MGLKNRFLKTRPKTWVFMGYKTGFCPCYVLLGLSVCKNNWPKRIRLFTTQRFACVTLTFSFDHAVSLRLALKLQLSSQIKSLQACVFHAPLAIDQ